MSWAIGTSPRGQPTLTADEALNNVPGVYVQNRSQYSQGQRIEIRGAGAGRIRGARGQDPAGRHPTDAARRAEPADQRRLRRPRQDRGAARPGVEPLRQRLGWRRLAAHPAGGAGAVLADGPLQAQLGSLDDMDKWQAISWPVAATSAASFPCRASPGRVPPEQRGRHRHLQPRPTWTRRSERPRPAADRQRPARAEPRRAHRTPSTTSIPTRRRRATSVAVPQTTSSSSRYRSPTRTSRRRATTSINVSAFAPRQVQNPLAAPPGDQAAAPIAGIYVAIDREAAARAPAAATGPAAAGASPLLTAGIDFQRLHDDRQNFVSVAASRPTASCSTRSRPSPRSVRSSRSTGPRTSGSRSTAACDTTG